MSLPASDPPTVLTGLASVSEYAFEEEGSCRMLLAVALRFSEGVLLVEALPEYDKCAIRLVTEPVLQHPHSLGAWTEVSVAAPWNRFVAGVSLWRWRLTNQSGYTDGAQVNLAVSGEPGDEVEVQWMVEASCLRASVLTPLHHKG